jgi:hypothetical protein
MNVVLKKISFLTVVPSIFFVNMIHAMDTPPKQSEPGRKLLLGAIQTKIPNIGLKKRLLPRACDEYYHNIEGDEHQYLEFSPNGKYLMEAREKNAAGFVITNMKTEVNAIIPFNVDWQPAITCNNKHVIIASNTYDGKNNLFKISLAKGTFIGNFSEKIDEKVNRDKRFYTYCQLAYNPYKSSFISISERDSGWLFCLHNSVTGDIKRHWKEEQSLGSGYRKESISYSPDGCYCAIFNEKYVHILDGETGEEKWNTAMPAEKVTWHPKRPFFIVHKDSSSCVMSAVTGEIIKNFYEDFELLRHRRKGSLTSDSDESSSGSKYESRWIEHSFFTADGKYLILVTTKKDTSIKIRDGNTFELVGHIQGDCTSSSAVCVSFDGKYLVYPMRRGRKDNIILYDLEQRKEVASEELKQGIRDIRWRPHTNQFISVAHDSTELVLWEIDAKG